MQPGHKSYPVPQYLLKNRESHIVWLLSMLCSTMCSFSTSLLAQRMYQEMKRFRM